MSSPGTFEALIADEEDHIDHLETQLSRIDELGTELRGMLNATAANAAPEA